MNELIERQNLNCSHFDLNVFDQISVLLTHLMKFGSMLLRYLSYVYEFMMEFLKFMVIKNDNMMDQSEEATAPFSWSIECIKPLSQKSSEEEDTKILSRSKKSLIMKCHATISIGFKIHCLRLLLAFIKYDKTKTKESAELILDQPRDMQSLLEREAFNDRNMEVKELCIALRQALKIYSLKYDFRIKCVDGWWKKDYTFEKIPKQNSGADGDSNQAMNSESETLDVADQCLEKPEIPNFKPVQENPVIITKQMLQRQIEAENDYLFVRRLPLEVVSDTLNSIIEFLLDEEDRRLEFASNNCTELYFFKRVFSFCRTPDPASLSSLGEEFERLHNKISSLRPRFRIIQTLPRYNRYNKTTDIKVVTYDKKLKSAPVDFDSAQRLNMAKPRSDDSSSECSSGAASQDRAEAVLEAQPETVPDAQPETVPDAQPETVPEAQPETVPEAQPETVPEAQPETVPEAQPETGGDANEDTVCPGECALCGETPTRKEQLLEALSVPVQCDKAIRMMRGMGWSGGALGARGDGITSPIMPKLNYDRRDGLGFIRDNQIETTTRAQITKVITTKTAPVWISEYQNLVEKARRESAVVENTKSPTFDLMEPRRSEVKRRYRKQAGVIVSERFTRVEFLKSIYAFLFNDAPYTTLKYLRMLPRKSTKFVKNTLSVINNRKFNCNIFNKEEISIYSQIQEKFLKMERTAIEATILSEHKIIELKRMMTEPLALTQQKASLPSSEAKAEIITEETIKAYILSTNTICNSQKTYTKLEFRLLVLMNILNLFESLNEESTVTFLMVFKVKELRYIKDVVNAVNMRINFGSSAAEKTLCQDIKKHTKDTLLDVRCDPKVLTLSKYCRIKHLNRPDIAVKRNYISETVSEDKMNVFEPTESENNNNDAENDSGITETNSTVSEDSSNEEVLPESSADDIINPYDSEDCSFEEYNYNKFTVPKLPPGEEGFDVSKYLNFYAKPKPNTTWLKNNNYIGNGNINMTENKNDDVDSGTSEYRIWDDYTQETWDDYTEESLEDYTEESLEDIAEDNIEHDTGNPSENIKDSDFTMKEDNIENIDEISIDERRFA